MDMQPKSLRTRRYTSMRCYVTNSYIGKSVHLLLRQTTYVHIDTIVSLSCQESNSEPARSFITIRTELHMYMGASTVPGIRDGSLFDSWQGKEIPLFSETSRLWGPAIPPVQRVPTTIYLGVKQPAA